MKFNVTISGSKRINEGSSTAVCKLLRDKCGITRKKQKDVIRRCINGESGHIKLFTPTQQEVHVNRVATKRVKEEVVEA